MSNEVQNPKVLILGGTGFLGTELSRLLALRHEVQVMNRADGIDLENPNPDSLRAYIQKNQIEVLLLVAAMTDVDLCLKDPMKSRQINFLGYQKLLLPLVNSGIKPVLFSSNNVFSGVNAFSVESETPKPSMVYGQHKVELETWITENFSNGVVFRTARILSSSDHAKNPISDLSRKLKAGIELTLTSDRKLTPVSAKDVASAVEAVLLCKLNGTFHLAMNAGYTWFEIGRAIKNKLGSSTVIHESESRDITGREIRPVNSTLSNQKAQQELGLKFQSLDEVIEEYFKS